ncbi:hypothetical protein [Burkholderia sp. BDU5]|uniref:hypothetical protein n=1 Tax=Burkholderia sp. BDU5 TaxID=1385590 RepID=UPI000AB5D863|nr:hypothetical protein [Burkholderia sp. BDU5]
MEAGPAQRRHDGLIRVTAQGRGQSIAYKRILADGFKAYLQFIPAFGAHLRSLAAGTKVLSTNRSHIASAEIALPSIAEQAAIAEVLSDMDAELATLEARRDKTRLLKQGMMQELLTGKTRLV